MGTDMLQRLKNKIIDYAFTKPKYPLRFRELMEANRIFTDNLDTDLIPGVKLCRLRLYLVYFIIWNLVAIPLVLIFHSLLEKLDCHLSILLAIVFTLLFFGTYKIFEEHMKKEAAKRLILDAWQNHLPHFDYDKHHEEVAQIYKEALDRDIPKRDIERFIIDKMINTA